MPTTTTTQTMDDDQPSMWYTNMENLSALARYLVDKDELPKYNFAIFIEKPYKWEPEWEEFLLTPDGEQYRIGRDPN